MHTSDHKTINDTPIRFISNLLTLNSGPAKGIARTSHICHTLPLLLRACNMSAELATPELRYLPSLLPSTLCKMLCLPVILKA